MALRKLSQTQLTPRGWLRDQLTLQATGLSGNIHRLFDDLGSNSGWLGGTGEVWERGAYYLDGIVPLAFLTKDEFLLGEVKKWVDAVLAGENETVGFGSVRNSDYWCRFVMLKALYGYYRATDDERIVPFIERYCNFITENIDKTGLFYWASARALESFEPIWELYLDTGNPVFINTLRKLKQYAYDWDGYFSKFKYVKPMTKYINRGLLKFGKAVGEPFVNKKMKSQKPQKPTKAKAAARFNKSYFVKTIMLTHGVNIAMAYKYPIYNALIDGKDTSELPYVGYQTVNKIHGLANGMLSSDEHISGNDAARGAELCAVVEQAYSFEETLRLTRDTRYADLTEFTVFNALPATFTEDMTAHQYVQQTNQYGANKKARCFYDCNKEANVFGVAPNFGCCAANMHQGFPKYAENLVYTDGKELYFYLYAPFSFETVLNGKRVAVLQEADYPFENRVAFTVTEGEFTAHFRIPPFAKRVTHNGEERSFCEGEYVCDLQSGDCLAIEFDFAYTVQKNGDGSVSIRRNNLLFAMPLRSVECFLRGEKPFHYREFWTDSRFAFAPVVIDGEVEVLEEKTNDTGGVPFSRSKPALSCKVRGREILNWKITKNSVGTLPVTPEQGKEIKLELVPYGSTYLRITQFPTVNAALDGVDNG